MSKKQIRAREERNRELAQLDASNRCAECKVSLLDRPAIQIVGSPEKFCSACYASFYTEAEREQFQADDV